MFSSFLSPNKTFIKELLNSKWYDGVLQFLRGAWEISIKLQNANNVLVKCENGYDKSAVLIALAELILNPYYRTHAGFPILVEK
jgi:hypothetical protein